MFKAEIVSLLRSYTLSGKRDSQPRIGIEVERLGVNACTGKRLGAPDDGERLTRFIHAYRAARGGSLAFEDEVVVGAKGDWGELSVEPGGQVEWASVPYGEFSALAEAFTGHWRVCDEVGTELGIQWLDYGLDPTTSAADAPWIGGARNRAMRAYFTKRGSRALETATQTASVHCAVDHSSESDWSRKFRAAVLLTPVAVALFANSRRYCGRETGYHSYRQSLWLATDRQRCILPASIFTETFHLNSWIDWVASLPPVFAPATTVRLEQLPATFAELCMQLDDERSILSCWEQHLSSVLTPVRSYDYIEIRSADLMPREQVLAVPAFWYALLYDPEAMSAAIEACRSISNREAWWQAFAIAFKGSGRNRSMAHFRELVNVVTNIALQAQAKLSVETGHLELVHREFLERASALDRA